MDLVRTILFSISRQIRIAGRGRALMASAIRSVSSAQTPRHYLPFRTERQSQAEGPHKRAGLLSATADLKQLRVALSLSTRHAVHAFAHRIQKCPPLRRAVGNRNAQPPADVAGDGTDDEA